MIMIDKEGSPIRCIICGEICVYDEGHETDPFTPNVHTPAGYREVFITKTCEDCFDNLFSEEEE